MDIIILSNTAMANLDELLKKDHFHIGRVKGPYIFWDIPWYENASRIAFTGWFGLLGRSYNYETTMAREDRLLRLTISSRHVFINQHE